MPPAQPAPVTPPPPEWAVNAARALEIDHHFGRMETQRIQDRAAIIARHAPARSQTGEGVERALARAERNSNDYRERWLSQTAQLGLREARIAELEAELQKANEECLVQGRRVGLLEAEVARLKKQLGSCGEIISRQGAKLSRQATQLRAPTPAPPRPRRHAGKGKSK